MTSGIDIVFVDSRCERDFAALSLLVYRTPTDTVSEARYGAYRVYLLQIRLVSILKNCEGLLVVVVYDVGVIGVQGWVEGSVQSVLHPGCGVVDVGGAIGAIQNPGKPFDSFHRLFTLTQRHASFSFMAPT